VLRLEAVLCPDDLAFEVRRQGRVFLR
jgi:hypothetical protein